MQTATKAPRGRVFSNAVANYSGRILSAVLNVAFVPLYLRLLGPEAYGLIGLFIVTQSMMQLLDFGLSATLNRELARLSTSSDTNRERADLIATFEAAYWAVGIVMAIAICAAAPFAAYRWIHAATLSHSALTYAVALMGLVIGVNWPVGLYSGGLLGLERHVVLNLTIGVFSIVRYGGAVLVLWFVHCDVLTYFGWQLIVSVVQVVYLRIVLWKAAGCRQADGRFCSAMLTSRASLILGISSTYIAMILLTQIDKVVVSRFVTLKEFAYYTVVWSAVSIFSLFYSPLSATLYPRITSLCGNSRLALAVQQYELGTELTAVLVFPACAVLCVSSREVLGVWMSNGEVTAHTWMLIRYLAPATAITSLLSLSNMLQWATGWTRVGFWTNAVAAVIMVPAVAIATYRGGILGAVIACSVIRTLQALAQFELTHRRYLPDRRWEWYRKLVATGIVSAIVALGAKALMSPNPTRLGTAAALMVSWLAATLAALACSRAARGRFIQLAHTIASRGAILCSSAQLP